MNHFFGIFLILISAASFGTMPILTKIVYESGITVNSLLFYRFFFAFCAMMPMALLQKKRFPKGRDFFILCAMGFIGYTGTSYFFFTALTIIPPSLVSILLYLYPVLVAVLSVFFLKEKFSPGKIAALFLAVSGTIAIAGFQANGNVHGILIGIMASVFYSIYIITGARVMKRNDTFSSTIVIIGSSAVSYFLFCLPMGFFIPEDSFYWLYILAISIVSTALAIYAFFIGIKLIGAVNASMLSTFEPVTSLFLSVLFLQEAIVLSQIIGTALILASAIIIATGSKKKDKH